jgi:hypothetical protein
VPSLYERPLWKRTVVRCDAIHPQKIKAGMMKKGVKRGSTYRVIIQNIHLNDVTLGAGDSNEMDDSEASQSETQTTTMDETSTTTEEEMTTEEAAENSGAGNNEQKSSNSSGQPGFEMEMMKPESLVLITGVKCNGGVGSADTYSLKEIATDVVPLSLETG